MTNDKRLHDFDYELDPEEIEILEAQERGEFHSLPKEEAEEEIKKAIAAANNTIAKRSPITIRLPNADVWKLKDQARRDGLPYQTLIASVLHQYVEGRFKRID